MPAKCDPIVGRYVYLALQTLGLPNADLTAIERKKGLGVDATTKLAEALTYTCHPNRRPSAAKSVMRSVLFYRLRTANRRVA